MRFLLDSNIIVPYMQQERGHLSAGINLLLASRSSDFFVSTASLWEIAIKTRLGKLQSVIPLPELPRYCLSLGFLILLVNEHHAVEDITDPPNTRDPFDRLLLSQCQVEGLRLVTTDRVLSEHPLAWRPS
jgi:PIN domain nuclease of toxin-antitoxin system